MKIRYKRYSPSRVGQEVRLNQLEDGEIGIRVEPNIYHTHRGREVICKQLLRSGNDMIHLNPVSDWEIKIAHHKDWFVLIENDIPTKYSKVIIQ